MSSKVSWRVGAVAALSLGLACAAGSASADTHWLVDGVFDDGGLLSGSFDIDVYGYINGASLSVTGGAFSDFTYTLVNSYVASGTIPPPDYNTYVAPYFIDLQPDYQADLHLEFQFGLIAPLANNPILGGFQGPSSECRYSFSCFVQGGETRYLATGSASAAVAGAPEPGTWALMLGGFGLAGAALRAARRKAATA